MLDDTEDARIEVWASMADHFLDTETRHDIPLTALKCAQAGLSAEEAREIWRFEVSPAVGFNLWLVAGEWALWDRAWLVDRIRRNHVAWKRRGVVARFLSRPWFDPARGVARSIERCLRALLEVESTQDRERLAKDMMFLARHYFDFCPKDVSSLEPDAYERLRALYPQPFRDWMEPATVRGEIAQAHARTERALQNRATR